MEITSDKEFSTVDQDRRGGFKFFLHPSDLYCCQLEVLVAIVLVHNHILGAYVIRDWRGGRGALKMIRVLHSGVQEMLTVYHGSGGST